MIWSLGLGMPFTLHQLSLIQLLVHHCGLLLLLLGFLVLDLLPVHLLQSAPA